MYPLNSPLRPPYISPLLVLPISLLLVSSHSDTGSVGNNTISSQNGGVDDGTEAKGSGLGLTSGREEKAGAVGDSEKSPRDAAAMTASQIHHSRTSSRATSRGEGKTEDGEEKSHPMEIMGRDGEAGTPQATVVASSSRKSTATTSSSSSSSVSRIGTKETKDDYRNEDKHSDQPTDRHLNFQDQNRQPITIKPSSTSSSAVAADGKGWATAGSSSSRASSREESARDRDSARGSERDETDETEITQTNLRGVGMLYHPNGNTRSVQNNNSTHSNTSSNNNNKATTGATDNNKTRGTNQQSQQQQQQQQPIYYSIASTNERERAAEGTVRTRPSTSLHAPLNAHPVTQFNSHASMNHYPPANSHH